MGSKVKCKFLSFLVTNASHISNKIDELIGIIEVNNASVTIVTESWLSDCTPASIISISRSFSVYRKDKPTPGGGIHAYVHKSMLTKRLQYLETDYKEVVSRLPRSYCCIITAGLYFPPGKSTNETRELIEYLTECLDLVLMERPSAGIVITGDFNHLNPSQICQRFCLRKVVRAPIRGSNILDQLLTNMFKLSNRVQNLPPLGRSGHQCILFTPFHQESQSKAISRGI